MLKNARNDRYWNLSYAGCSCHNSKQDRRRVKHSMKRREQRQWQDELAYDRPWTEARYGELWEINHNGQVGLWLCIDPGWNGSTWKSWDGRWYLIEDEDLDAISWARFTGTTIDVEALAERLSGNAT